MVDLGTWANIAEIVGGATVIGGVVFALYQVRHLRQQRVDGAAVELVHTVQTRAFLDAFDYFSTTRAEDDDDQTWRPGSPGYRAMMDLGIAAETLAVLVARRMVPLDLVDELIGGTLRMAWLRIEGHVVRWRETSGNRHYFEWTQWLVEQLHQHPAPSKVDGQGAYVAYRDWRP